MSYDSYRTLRVLELFMTSGKLVHTLSYWVTRIRILQQMLTAENLQDVIVFCFMGP